LDLKRNFRTILFFLAVSSKIFPFEMGAMFHIENLSFKKDRTVAETGFSSSDLTWGLSSVIAHSTPDKWGFDIKFDSNLPLRNILYSYLTFSTEYFNFKIGPTLGLFNSTEEIIKFGLSGEVLVEYPGKIFLSMGGITTPGGDLTKSGEYLQTGGNIVFGFYVPNAICSFYISTKRYTEKISSGKSIDKMNEYYFNIKIFEKNIAYKINIKIGYQRLIKEFTGTFTTKNIVNSIILGTALDIEISNYLVLRFDIDNSLYSFGQENLTGTNMKKYFFKISSGFLLDISAMKK